MYVCLSCPSKVSSRLGIFMFVSSSGLTSFLSLGIPAEKLVLGVPWYGYLYPCINYTQVWFPSLYFVSAQVLFPCKFFASIYKNLASVVCSEESKSDKANVLLCVKYSTPDLTSWICACTHLPSDTVGILAIVLSVCYWHMPSAQGVILAHAKCSRCHTDTC